MDLFVLAAGRGRLAPQIGRFYPRNPGFLSGRTLASLTVFHLFCCMFYQNSSSFVVYICYLKEAICPIVYGVLRCNISRMATGCPLCVCVPLRLLDSVRHFRPLAYDFNVHWVRFLVGTFDLMRLRLEPGLSPALTLPCVLMGGWGLVLQL